MAKKLTKNWQRKPYVLTAKMVKNYAIITNSLDQKHLSFCQLNQLPKLNQLSKSIVKMQIKTTLTHYFTIKLYNNKPSRI
ncbi:hypothetical protein MOMA_03260 [Moraxella macacae 0408225]|uniref:Uncharacterized protein n=1 Tax=Moraxella macacae 0408225 TaxID=1230338 RepID=L2FA91_9GAMM|nr:hypothetical protein MOMA_03260 [Moraxella macacae 0408225]